MAEEKDLSEVRLAKYVQYALSRGFSVSIIKYSLKDTRLASELYKEPDNPVTATTVKTQLLIAVRQLLGTEGAAHKVDILKYDQSERRFILRCDSDHYVRLRAALTLASTFEGEPCSYSVHKASPNLLSFTANSRTYKH
ncbi:uncharacterized protein LOC100679019 isoform X3 [Nasonia vitripennis]|uniref:Uncharacterized protein n=1 Tax=Nasonia vitripennis TaxID=7425 RepID=A0A7M7QE63_NASVI|nr:uncharacterized protein LOC100679019 isoform X3 [Nasonia vitripennis]